MNLLSTGEFMVTLSCIHAACMIYCVVFGTLFHLERMVGKGIIAQNPKQNYFPAWIDYGIMFSSSKKNSDSGWHVSVDVERYGENIDGGWTYLMGTLRELAKVFHGGTSDNYKNFKALATFMIVLGLFIVGGAVFKLIYFYVKYESNGPRRMYLKLNYKLIFVVSIISVVLEMILMLCCVLQGVASEFSLYGLFNSIYHIHYRETMFILVFAFVLSFFIIYASKTGIKLQRQYNRTGQLGYTKKKMQGGKAGYKNKANRYSEYSEYTEADSESDSDTYSDTYSSDEDDYEGGRRSSVKPKRHSFRKQKPAQPQPYSYQGYGASGGRAQPSPYGSNRGYPKAGQTRSAPRY